jgi:hypothetical protein
MSPFGTPERRLWDCHLRGDDAFVFWCASPLSIALADSKLKSFSLAALLDASKMSLISSFSLLVDTHFSRRVDYK